ncbi:hypothetical protein ACFX11_008793 [Malus domestica]
MHVSQSPPHFTSRSGGHGELPWRAGEEVRGGRESRRKRAAGGTNAKEVRIVDDGRCVAAQPFEGILKEKIMELELSLKLDFSIEFLFRACDKFLQEVPALK